MDPAGFEPSDGDAASSLSVSDAGPSNRKATKEARAKVDDLRRQMNNTVAAAARVSVDEDLVNAMRIVALGTRCENGVGSFEDELKEADETHTEDDEWSICSLADSTVEGKKNLNDANKTELSNIPTIGEVLSKRIHEGQPFRDWSGVRALPQVGPVRIAELQKAFYLVHTHS
jgi:DNA uptake protein ComE-like DNA-binding protein